MADNELFVTISGAALSLLFYENLREIGDQMGFFLGNVHTYVTKNVTDAERHVESTKIHTDIQGILPHFPTDILYLSTGRINTKKLKEFVKNKRNQIVGWYRFRLNGPMYHTVRDKILHKQFQDFFYGLNNDMSEHHFVSCVVSYGMTSGKGLHKFRHVFLRYKDGNYPPIPLKINNLGADASRHDGSDYKPTPIKSLRNETDYFAKFIDKLKLDVSQVSSVDSVTSILKAAEEHLDDLVKKVATADREVTDLEQEAQDLVEKIEANRKKNLRISCEEKYPGETYQGLIKWDTDQTNRVYSSDELTEKVSRFATDSRRRPSSPPMNVPKIIPDSGTMKKSPSTKYSYSQATKKKDNTDCS